MSKWALRTAPLPTANKNKTKETLRMAPPGRMLPPKSRNQNIPGQGTQSRPKWWKKKHQRKRSDLHLQTPLPSDDGLLYKPPPKNESGKKARPFPEAFDWFAYSQHVAGFLPMNKYNRQLMSFISKKLSRRRISLEIRISFSKIALHFKNCVALKLQLWDGLAITKLPAVQNVGCLPLLHFRRDSPCRTVLSLRERAQHKLNKRRKKNKLAVLWASEKQHYGRWTLQQWPC